MLFKAELGFALCISFCFAHRILHGSWCALSAPAYLPNRRSWRFSPLCMHPLTQRSRNVPFALGPACQTMHQPWQWNHFLLSASRLVQYNMQHMYNELWTETLSEQVIRDKSEFVLNTKYYITGHSAHRNKGRILYI